MSRKRSSAVVTNDATAPLAIAAMLAVVAFGAAGSAHAQECQACVRYINSTSTSHVVSSGSESFNIAFNVVACEDDDGAALVVPVSIIRSAGNAPSVSSVNYDPDGAGSQSSVSLTWQEGASTSSDPISDNRRKRVEMWLMAGPAVSSGAGGVVTVTFSPGSTGEVIAGAIQACGVNQTTPVINRGTSNNQTSSNFAVVAPQTAEGALLIDTIALDGNLTATLRYTFMAGSWNSNTGSTSSNLRAASSRIASADGVTYNSDLGDTQNTRYNISASTYHALSALTLNPNSTTAVKIESATAAQGSGGATLRWRTAHEAETLGFNILTSVDGELAKVNEGLIAGSALSFAGMPVRSGYSYAWLDPAGQVGDQYWIEEVELGGRSWLHGPLVVEPGQLERAPEVSATVTELAKQAQQRGATTRIVRETQDEAGAKGATDRRSPTLTTQQRIAAGPALRMRIERDGWYRLTAEAITAAGLDVSSIDVDSLHLFRDGVEQGTRVNGAEDGVLGPGDSIEFFGRVSETDSSGTSAYWLAVDDATRRVDMKLVDQSSLPQAEIATFRETVELKERTVYVAGVLNGERENFFGDVIVSDPVENVVASPGAVAKSRDALLELAVQGFTDTPRRLLVEVNGISVGELDLVGNEWRSARLRVPADRLNDGDNVVTLIPDDEGISLVDRMSLTYDRRTEAVDDQLDVVTSAAWNDAFTVSGFTSSTIRAAFVMNPSRPVEIRPSVHQTRAGSSATLAPIGSPWSLLNRRLYVFAEDAVLTPSDLLLDSPSSWSSEGVGADLLIIGHASLLGAVDPLVTRRESQGLTVAVVDVQDVYDELSYGNKSPEAIRQLIATAMSRWKRAPRYVLLVGDGTYDPRDYLGYGGDLVPTRWVESGVYETVSDDWFADVGGDGSADVALGRLPAATSTEVAGMVEKIIDFEIGGQSLGSALLVADAPEFANFDLINDRLEADITPFATTERLSATGVEPATMRDELLTALGTGFPLVHYSGHGGVDSWRQGILTSDDAGALSNLDDPSVFVMMNCLNGVFQEPLLTSLGEALLRAPGGGVAIWASSGTTDSAVQEQMMESFYSVISTSTLGLRLGDAILAAKASTPDAGVRETWVLLGDPSLQVR